MAPLSSTMTLKRIHREIADLKKEDLGDMTLAPADDSLFFWRGTIPGPKGSPYEDGVFKLDVQLAPDYPFSAPRVTFTTRIYHMNVSDRGSICIDILKHNWSPALSLFKVMLSLSSLLTDPNPMDPLVPSIATTFVRNRKQHDKLAKQWTEQYAMPPPPPVVIDAADVVPSTPARRDKGKRKAEPPRTQTDTETIILDDSDSEQSSSRSITAGGKRKRKATGNDVVDLVDEGEVPSSKRRVPDRDGDIVCHPHSVQGSSNFRAEEVIVIDD